MNKITYFLAFIIAAKQVLSLSHYETFYLPSSDELLSLEDGAFYDLSLNKQEMPTNRRDDGGNAVQIFFAGADIDSNDEKWLISYFARTEELLHLLMLRDSILQKIGRMRVKMNTVTEYPIQAYAPSTQHFYVLFPDWFQIWNLKNFVVDNIWERDFQPRYFRPDFSYRSMLKVSEDERVILFAQIHPHETSWCLYDRRAKRLNERCRQDVASSIVGPRRCMDLQVDFATNKLSLFFDEEFQILNISSQNTCSTPTKGVKKSRDHGFSTHFFNNDGKNLMMKISPEKIELFDWERNSTVLEKSIEYNSIETADSDAKKESIRFIGRKGTRYAIDGFRLSRTPTKSAMSAVNFGR